MWAAVGLGGAAALATAASPLPIVGTTLQEDAHIARAWRPLTAGEQSQFDLGYAVFNTEWVPAGHPSGRIDGLGPHYSAPSCDACHNSRRRGRSSDGDGEAPPDLVMQLGRLTSGRVVRGNHDYGYVLNAAAIIGQQPEAVISIRYQARTVRLADGAMVELRQPRYVVASLSGPSLAPDTVLMPRSPPLVQGSGLLELVPAAELQAILDDERLAHVPARVSRVHLPTGVAIGRFGWQATEPSVASQIAVAFAREMGLTNPLENQDDCGKWDSVCRSAPSGGDPEVQSDLFQAVITFERLHSVPIAESPAIDEPGERLFVSTGCAQCHRSRLRVHLPSNSDGMQRDACIRPYTDLLLHDLGAELADRTVGGAVVPSLWRTAPLWGLQASAATRQPLHLLHDGRARSVEEAILWHGGDGGPARGRYRELSQGQRRLLVNWIQSR